MDQPPTQHNLRERKYARRGDLDSLKAIYRGYPTEDTWICAIAASCNHLDTLQWLHQQGYPWGVNTTAGAAEAGNLPMLKWLREKRCPWNDSVCGCAANIDVLKYALDNACPLATWTAGNATRDMDMLKLAHHHGCALGPDVATEIARHGDLDMMKWARQHGCEWSEDTCTKAAYFGHLHMLKWLIKEGCPMDQHQLNDSQIRNHTHVYKFLANKFKWKKYKL